MIRIQLVGISVIGPKQTATAVALPFTTSRACPRSVFAAFGFKPGPSFDIHPFQILREPSRPLEHGQRFPLQTGELKPPIFKSAGPPAWLGPPACRDASKDDRVCSRRSACAISTPRLQCCRPRASLLGADPGECLI